MISHAEKLQLLRQLEDGAGRIDPDSLVAAASAASHPLHGHFEWNDTEAARKYRRVQAQSLIRSIHLTVTIENLPLVIPAYVREMRGETIAGYRAVMQVRSDADSARATVVDAMQRVASAVKRAKSLAAVFGVAEYLAQIDELTAAVLDRTRPNLDNQPKGAA